MWVSCSLPVAKSEIRNPRSEKNPKSEARIGCPRLGAGCGKTAAFGFRPSGLFRISDFGLRILFLRVPERIRSRTPTIGRDIASTFLHTSLDEHKGSHPPWGAAGRNEPPGHGFYRPLPAQVRDGNGVRHGHLTFRAVLNPNVKCQCPCLTPLEFSGLSFTASDPLRASIKS